MSWYTDTELYVGYTGRGTICYWRLQKTFDSPLASEEFHNETPVRNHLSLVDYAFEWKKSDFDALMAFIYRHDLLVNSHGFACPITYPRDREMNHKPNMDKSVYFWSREIVDLSSFGLPVRSVPFQKLRYMGGRPAPVEPNPEDDGLAAELAECIAERDEERAKNQAREDGDTSIKNDLEREVSEKQALVEKVSELEAEIISLKRKVSRLKGKKLEHRTSNYLSNQKDM